MTTNSTRRLLARPSGVAWVSMGFSMPKPSDVSRCGAIPFCTRYSRTHRARRCDRPLVDAPETGLAPG